MINMLQKLQRISRNLKQRQLNLSIRYPKYNLCQNSISYNFSKHSISQNKQQQQEINVQKTYQHVIPSFKDLDDLKDFLLKKQKQDGIFFSNNLFENGLWLKYRSNFYSKKNKQNFQLFYVQGVVESRHRNIYFVGLTQELPHDQLFNSDSNLDLKLLQNQLGKPWYRKKLDYKLDIFKHPQPYTEAYNILTCLNKEIQQLQYTNLKTGGEYSNGHLIRDLYVCNQLPLIPKDKERLVKLINDLGDKTQDHHELSPVQDIVDPELNPYYPKSTIDPSFYRDEDFKNEIQECLDEQMRWFKYQEDEHYKEHPQTKENNEYVSLRSLYQWIPTQFQINRNQQLEIIGEIHNLPRENNEEFYSLIKKCFQEMLPAFQKIGLINYDQQQNDTCNLQVVVKIQKYNIKPKTMYEGKWHLEGKTENIKGVGVYYCQIDPHLEQSGLRFSQIHREFEGEGRQAEWQNSVNIQDGSTVVFKNCPHKVSGIYNYTDEILSRTILSFFIVNPQKPLKDTIYFHNLKQKLTEEFGKEKLEEKLREHGLETNIQIGKQKRAEVRKNAAKEKNGWGYIHYGNEGDTFFLDGFQSNLEKDTYFNYFDEEKSYAKTLNKNDK